jgi:hypothetical protein
MPGCRWRDAGGPRDAATRDESETAVPKEKIYDSVEMYDIEIGWSASAEYVAVGLMTHDGRSIAQALATEVTGERDAQPGGPIGMADPGREPAAAEFSSLWATLNRQQINRLIWVLRRARDTAYGRDE